MRQDPRSDLFALGVLLYFFSTGERPFGESETMAGMRRRLWRDPYPPRRLRPDYPPWLQEIVLRCLETEPAWRYPTASQVAFELSHPSQVKLTARSERMKRDPWTTVLRRRFNTDLKRPRTRSALAVQLAAAPIIAVAVDIAEEATALDEALRATAARILATLPEARLACLNVLRQGRITLDTTLDAQGHNKHLDRLVALKHWAEPLKLEDQRLTVHVLEAIDPAAAILDFVRANRVDHLLVGARQSSLRRTLLGSVSASSCRPWRRVRRRTTILAANARRDHDESGPRRSREWAVRSNGMRRVDPRKDINFWTERLRRSGALGLRDRGSMRGPATGWCTSKKDYLDDTSAYAYDRRHARGWIVAQHPGCLHRGRARPRRPLPRSPDELSEVEVRSYLLHLRDERGVAHGTFQPRTPASSSSTCVRSSATGRCSRKKGQSPQAQAPARRSVGREARRHRPRKNAGRGPASVDVRVWPAHLRGRQAAGQGDRRAEWPDRVVGKGNKERCVPLPRRCMRSCATCGRRIATGNGCAQSEG